MAALVVQAQARLVPASISSMVLTRYYARIPFDNHTMELSRSRNGRFISITLHADGATGLLAQVHKSRLQLILGSIDLLLRVADTLLSRNDRHPFTLPAICLAGQC